ncbi:MAG: exodeoxyribonuclease VII large subunit [Spirochaetales bacterium]|nr:exodeoxyribonuclease VII large subunit [Spirochaetales bacterium]
MDDFYKPLTGKKKCYQVSEITGQVRLVIEGQFQDITVEGEISNFRPSSTGHFYFSLKDADAVLSTVVFKNRSYSLSFTPKDGMLVKATGNLSVYPKRGTYQLIVEEMVQSGQGEILAMLEELKKKLAREGLFDEERKKKLPFLPSRVAVVTSPTGAALKDILRILRRRNAGINLIVLPAPVQGDEAAPVIARQIRVANLHRLAEVIIVGRGGGSLEDLLPFSDEEVVRAIAASDIPVISAVGHEIDYALSDLASDVRAPTPSAAAELVAVSRDELLRRVREEENILTTHMNGKLERVRLIMNQFKLENLEKSFQIFIQPILLRFDDARESLIQSLSDRLRDFRHRLEILTHQMEANSPLGILKRGYAVVTNEKTGKIIKSSARVKLEDLVRITLHEGKLKALIKEKE